MNPRTYLFVPGNRPDRFAKAAASGADRIILDLEDAVAPSEKDAARDSVVQWFWNGGHAIVRVNSSETPWFEDDLAALRGLSSAGIMLPKADVASVKSAREELHGRETVALIETVSGLIGLGDLLSARAVSRLAFGHLDFGTDARIPGGSRTLDPARFQLALWSRQAGLPPPIDGVTVEISDPNRLAEDVRQARDLGFTAKLCIHPNQLDAVHKGFAPTPDEVAWARRIRDAGRQGGDGVVQVDGKMVDKPVFDRAEAILAGLSEEKDMPQ